jgi:hypothetical protein
MNDVCVYSFVFVCVCRFLCVRTSVYSRESRTKNSRLRQDAGKLDMSRCCSWFRRYVAPLSVCAPLPLTCTPSQHHALLATRLAEVSQDEFVAICSEYHEADMEKIINAAPTLDMAHKIRQRWVECPFSMPPPVEMISLGASAPSTSASSTR